MGSREGDPANGGGRRASGELEHSVLSVLWAVPDALSAAQVNAALPGDLAYTTVLTTLARLHGKGTLTRRRVGRRYAYRPVRDEAAHTAARMASLLDRGPDRAAVLARFVAHLSDQDEQLVHRLLQAAAPTAQPGTVPPGEG